MYIFAIHPFGVIFCDFCARLPDLLAYLFGEKMNELRPSPHFHQDCLLLQLEQSKAPVCIYLLNGVKLQGHVAKFDAHVIILRSGTNDQMVFKHAVLTIVPSI